MVDTRCDLAALVFERDENPDEVLRGFAADLKARGYRVAGLLQSRRHRVDARNLQAMLLHSGEKLPLLQDLGPSAAGCRLDVGQLLDAGTQVAGAIEEGADIVIVNRFGKQESEGKGLSYLIEHALGAGIPVVIAVASHRLSDWTKFAGSMSEKLRCDRDALHAWWSNVTARNAKLSRQESAKGSEVLK